MADHDDSVPDETFDVNRPFDAVAAAAELEDAMDKGGCSGDGGEQYAEMLEAEVLELNRLLEQQVASTRAAEARADQAQGEVEAAKQRLATDAKRQVQRRSRELLLEFLEVIDDLDRALAAARDSEHTREVVAGVELVRRRLESRLEQGSGVRRQGALGAVFDPALHEAGGVTAVSDRDQDGRVVAVIRQGFTIGDEVLRPALVMVGKRMTA